MSKNIIDEVFALINKNIVISVEELLTLQDVIASNYSAYDSETTETVDNVICDFIAGLISIAVCKEMCSNNKSIYGEDDESLTGSFCITPYIDKEHHNEWMKEFYKEYCPFP